MTVACRRFTPVFLDELTRGGPVVILAPRPDDESLAHETQLGPVVDDDPEGSTMQPDFVAFFVAEPEIYHAAEAGL